MPMPPLPRAAKTAAALALPLALGVLCTPTASAQGVEDLHAAGWFGYGAGDPQRNVPTDGVVVLPVRISGHCLASATAQDAAPVLDALAVEVVDDAGVSVPGTAKLLDTYAWSETDSIFGPGSFGALWVADAPLRPEHAYTVSLSSDNAALPLADVSCAPAPDLQAGFELKTAAQAAPPLEVVTPVRVKLVRGPGAPPALELELDSGLDSGSASLVEHWFYIHTDEGQDFAPGVAGLGHATRGKVTVPFPAHRADGTYCVSVQSTSLLHGSVRLDDVCASEDGSSTLGHAADAIDCDWPEDCVPAPEQVAIDLPSEPERPADKIVGLESGCGAAAPSAMLDAAVLALLGLVLTRRRRQRVA